MVVRPGPGESSASGQARTPRAPQSGVIGFMIKVSAPPSEYVVGRAARPSAEDVRGSALRAASD